MMAQLVMRGFFIIIFHYCFKEEEKKYLRHQTTHVTCHVSHVICHMLLATCNVSHVTRHMPFTRIPNLSPIKMLHQGNKQKKTQKT